MNLTIFSLLISLLTVATTSSSAPNFDAFFDNVLRATLKQKASVIEPLNVTEIASRFNRTIVLVRVTGEASFSDIKVTGLTSLKRIAPSARENLVDGNIQVTAQLAMEDLQITANGRVKLYRFGPERQFTGKVKAVAFVLSIIHNPKTDEVKLNNFSLTKLENLTLRQVGSSTGRFGDAITNTVIRTAIIPFKTAIRLALSSVVRRNLSEQIDEIAFLKKVFG